MGDTLEAKRKPDVAGLFELATTQRGYFTTYQAAAFGFGSDLLNYHLRSGRFIRLHRGVYRFRDYPTSAYEAEMVAWLVVGRDTSIISHESALEMFDLSDVIPGTIHITVPRARRNLPRIPGVTIHTTTRPYKDIDVASRHGFRVASPTRAIVDVAEAGLAPEQVEMAICQAIQRGLTVDAFLRELASTRGRRVQELIESGIAKALDEIPNGGSISYRIGTTTQDPGQS